MRPLLTFLLFLFAHFPLLYCGCYTSNLIDAGSFSSELNMMKKQLGGNTDVDLWFPVYKHSSPIGQVVITCTCELECFDFDSLLTRPCRWRNEDNSCDGTLDELDWTRMRGRWGQDEGSLLFGKKDSPDGFFLIAGTDKLVPEGYSALLVSDPVQCQQGDGIVRFRHWATPAVRVRVCVRPPSMGKRFDWCSEPVKRNDSKLVEVVIPGSITQTFEIVIEAYNFTLNAFGKQGGVAAIDDISYNASAIYECQMIPHTTPAPKMDKKSCKTLKCDFDSGECLKQLKSTGWKTSSEAVGNKMSGINDTLEDSFAYATGPGTYSFQLGPFTLPRPFALEFCFFLGGTGTAFKVQVADKRDERQILFENNNFLRRWVCEKIMLRNETYEYVGVFVNIIFQYLGGVYSFKIEKRILPCGRGSNRFARSPLQPFCVSKSLISRFKRVQ